MAAAPQHSWHSSTDDTCFQKRRRLTTTCAQATADCAGQQQDLQQAAKQRRMPVTVISGFLGTFNDAHARHTSLQAECGQATIAGASIYSVLAAAHLWLVAAGRSSQRLAPCFTNACPASAGAGKTTLLNNILSNQAGQRIAVLVNDMASLNIDERLVAQNVVQSAGQQLVALSNGCICCTIQEDLVREIKALAAQQVGGIGLRYCTSSTEGLLQQRQCLRMS